MSTSSLYMSNWLRKELLQCSLQGYIPAGNSTVTNVPRIKSYFSEDSAVSSPPVIYPLDQANNIVPLNDGYKPYGNQLVRVYHPHVVGYAGLYYDSTGKFVTNPINFPNSFDPYWLYKQIYTLGNANNTNDSQLDPHPRSYLYLFTADPGQAWTEADPATRLKPVAVAPVSSPQYASGIKLARPWSPKGFLGQENTSEVWDVFTEGPVLINAYPITFTDLPICTVTHVAVVDIPLNGRRELDNTIWMPRIFWAGPLEEPLTVTTVGQNVVLPAESLICGFAAMDTTTPTFPVQFQNRFYRYQESTGGDADISGLGSFKDDSWIGRRPKAMKRPGTPAGLNQRASHIGQYLVRWAPGNKEWVDRWNFKFHCTTATRPDVTVTIQDWILTSAFTGNTQKRGLKQFGFHFPFVGLPASFQTHGSNWSRTVFEGQNWKVSVQAENQAGVSAWASVPDGIACGPINNNTNDKSTSEVLYGNPGQQYYFGPAYLGIYNGRDKAGNDLYWPQGVSPHNTRSMGIETFNFLRSSMHGGMTLNAMSRFLDWFSGEQTSPFHFVGRSPYAERGGGYISECRLTPFLPTYQHMSDEGPVDNDQYWDFEKLTMFAGSEGDDYTKGDNRFAFFGPYDGFLAPYGSPTNPRELGTNYGVGSDTVAKYGNLAWTPRGYNGFMKTPSEVTFPFSQHFGTVADSPVQFDGQFYFLENKNPIYVNVRVTQRELGAFVQGTLRLASGINAATDLYAQGIDFYDEPYMHGVDTYIKVRSFVYQMGDTPVWVTNFDTPINVLVERQSNPWEYKNHDGAYVSDRFSHTPFHGSDPFVNPEYRFTHTHWPRLVIPTGSLKFRL